MGIINKIFALVRRKSIKTVRDVMTGRIFNLGALSYEQVFRLNAWVYSCIRAIAMSSMHADLLIKNFEGGINEKWTEFFGLPNPHYTGKRLIANTLAWMNIRGFAVWIIKAGLIELLDSDNVVAIERLENGYRIDYYNGAKQGFTVYPPEMVVIFQGFNPFQRLVGLSPEEPIKRGVTMQDKAEKLNERLIDNGAFLPGYFTTEQPLNERQRERIREEWKNRHAGYLNAGNPLVLEGGLEFKPLMLTPQDIQYIDLEKLTRDKISSVYGVPSVMINVIEKVNYATARQQVSLFWNNTLIPILKEVADVITYQVLTKLTNEKLFAEFDTSNVKELQEDEERKANVDKTYIQAGVLTINEVRERLGLEPVPYGNTWWGPANYVPLSDVPTDSEGKGLKKK